MPGTLYVVATPIGNLEDVTLRAIRTLGEVALIAAEDTRRTAKLLAHYGIRTPTTSLHEHNERRKLASVLARLEQGDDVALVSDAGTPGISDPGGKLIGAAIAAGIHVAPIPGPSAILAALVVSGLSTGTFLFLGFPPSRSIDRKRWFRRVAAHPDTLVVYEAPHRFHGMLEDALEVLGDREVCVARELTKKHEELVRGPISSVLAGSAEARGEYCVVISGSQDPDKIPIQPPNETRLLREFCHITEDGANSRRAAIVELAQRYGMSAKQVYQAIEKAKAERV